METIEVGYRHIGTKVGIEYYHKFLIYTDSNGNQTTISGWAPYDPSDPNNLSPDSSLPYGNIDIKIDEPYNRDNPDFPTSEQQFREPITQGDDLSDIWDEMMENALNRDGKYPYDPASQNCGTLADQLLRDAGLPEPSNDNFLSPGEHWVPGSGNEMDEGIVPISPIDDPLGALGRMLEDGIIDLLDGIAAGQAGEELGNLLGDLGKELGKLLDMLPDDLVPDFIDGLLGGLDDIFPNGLLPYLFNLFPVDLDPLINVPWKEAMYLDFWISPLALDLDGDGVETFGITSDKQVLFDHDGDGVRNGTGWVKSDDGLLVLDRNGNGTIDNGGELFGVYTKVNGANAQNGFEALKAEDTNKDGKFDANDTNFSNVRVWRDMDSDVLLFVA